VTPPGLLRKLWRTGFTWGFLSQGASSATNFGLTFLGGRIAGAAGLGSIFLGFVVYLLALGAQRALICDPLVATSTTLTPAERAETARHGLTMCLALGAVTTAVTVLLTQIPGDIGHGVGLFAPWLLPALVQDYWRAVLFRDRRGRAAAVNDSLWAVAMIATAPLAVAMGTAWAAVMCWGVGATVGAAVGFVQTRTPPGRPSDSFAWWTARAWPLGKWLSGSFAVFTLGSQVLIFVLAAVLTTRELGGFRAGQSIFAPLTLIAPALSLPGLPYLAEQVRSAPTHAVRAAARLGLGGATVGVVYLAVMAATGGRVMEWVYGRSFARFDGLVWPFGVGQLVTIASIGFALLLRAQSRGGALFVGRAVGAVSGLGLGVAGALAFAVTGAAWGATVGSALAGLTMILLAVRPIEGGRVPPLVIPSVREETAFVPGEPTGTTVP
jgi:O-antigen/teichoic acid export membrane protein